MEKTNHKKLRKKKLTFLLGKRGFIAAATHPPTAPLSPYSSQNDIDSDGLISKVERFK